MQTLSELTSNQLQPRQPGMGRFGYGSGDIKVKNRLSTASALLSQTTPPRVAPSIIAMPDHSISDEVDIDIVLIGRQMTLKI